jgi:hypothetical protein
MEVTMCRWVAYAGPEIYLEDLVFHQEHSIVSQSLAATQSSWVTNGDGFGVAWFTQRTTPGLFKDVLPAWKDANLRSLPAKSGVELVPVSAKIESPLKGPPSQFVDTRRALDEQAKWEKLFEEVFMNKRR